MIVAYSKQYKEKMMVFLRKCLPESGRTLDIEGQHAYYKDIDHYFHRFWLMIEAQEVIGTVAIKEMADDRCELKSFYLLEAYHGQGLGYSLLCKAISYAREHGYKRMYLDSLSTSLKALALYKRFGFTETQKYNDATKADVFMVLNLVQNTGLNDEGKENEEHNETIF